MKSAGRLSRYLALGVALVATYLVANTAEAREGEAIVRAVRGTAAKVSRPAQEGQQGAESPLRVGQRLRAGEAVKTAAGSEVDLFLNQNGPVVRVKENSLLRFDTLTVEGGREDAIVETEMNLQSGQILGNVRKLAEASSYNVQTPTTVAGIRGTQYVMSSSGETTVIAGSVVVVYVNPDTQTPTTLTVHAGQTFYPPTDGSDPTEENVVETPGEIEAAAMNAIVAATTFANSEALEATIAELATAAAAKAASLAAPGEANAAAASAAAAAVNAAVATAQATAQSMAGQEGQDAVAAAGRAAQNAQATAVAAAATGAAAVAAANATAQARDAGLDQAQVTEAAIQAATQAATQAALAAGASSGQAATIGVDIGTNVGLPISMGPGAPPGGPVPVPVIPPSGVIDVVPPDTTPPTVVITPPTQGPPIVPPDTSTRVIPEGGPSGGN